MLRSVCCALPPVFATFSLQHRLGNTNVMSTINSGQKPADRALHVRGNSLVVTLFYLNTEHLLINNLFLMTIILWRRQYICEVPIGAIVSWYIQTQFVKNIC